VDNVVGIVNSRQLMYALKEGRDNDDVRSIMHGPYFIPETKNLDDLLEELQRKRLHMAIVVDEYGDTAGLVTMEDLLEEIVGEIRDEYDTEEPLYRRLGDNSISVDARITIYELNEIMAMDLPEDESFATLGGFLFDLMGKVPRRGDNATFKDFDFVVEKMAGRRISTVLIRKHPENGKLPDDKEGHPAE
jgi:CBS domain containing-hemolysin-like protein